MGDRVNPRERPFRFGVFMGDSYTTGAQWMNAVRRVEDEGWSTLLVGDHYIFRTSCTARLAMAAAVTTTLRLGSYVYCNDFRHPAMLANEGAELARLSDGRFELGIGAGWLKQEYDMIGLPFDPGSVRADRFQEAVGIVRSVLAGEAITHHGDHYTLVEYAPPTSPLDASIPLLLGGGGPRMVRFAARNADIIGFDPKSSPEGWKDPREWDAPAFEEKLRIVDDACADREDGGPERSILIFEAARSLHDRPDEDWMDPQQAANSPYALVGEPSVMVDTLLERRERWGLSYYVIGEDDREAVRPAIAALAGQ
jgi:probable F420-dependent oxidoreductase